VFGSIAKFAGLKKHFQEDLLPKDYAPPSFLKASIKNGFDQHPPEGQSAKKNQKTKKIQKST